MKAVAGFLQNQEIPFQLLAPTGRAAKNLASKSGFGATTIHSSIYSVETNVEKAVIIYTLKTNLVEKQQLFIIDESSMVGDKVGSQDGYLSPRTLMADFVRYVKQGENSNKILFVGDSCQLPPVGYEPFEQAPALNEAYIIQNFGLKGTTVELSKVMRQAEGSYILQTAYEVRTHILNPKKGIYADKIGNFMGKVENVAKLYVNQYLPNKHDKVAIISYSNKYVNDCNRLVRAELGISGILCEGDRVVLNQNYYGKSFAYINNGEVGKIKTVGSKSQVASLSFVEVEIEFKDAFDQLFTVNSKVMLDILKDPKALTLEKKKELFATAFRSNPTFRKSGKIWDDENLSAMQIGYGHAFTCHKAQGSEWDTVLLNSWSPTKDHRFLYTGITRARKNLYTNSGHLF